MNLNIHFLVLLLLLGCSSWAEQFTHEYTAAALTAARRGDCELVEVLVKKGADPNAIEVGGHTLLVYACEKTYGLKPEVSVRINHIKFLLSKGANVNFSDSFGVVPLLAADRVGSKELVDLLKSNGANDLDWADTKIKAAATLIDGELLIETLERVNVEDGSKYFLPVLQYKDLEKYVVSTSLKVAKNRGNDIFGRPFGLSTFHGERVTVHPDTLKDLKTGTESNSDYWKYLDQSAK